MRQFLVKDDAAFRDLESRARLSCIRFRDQEMPPGCSATHADVGFQIDHTSGLAMLFVTRGMIYVGHDPDMLSWFRDGVKFFRSFAELKAWLQGPLKESFNMRPGISETLPEASQLTNLPAVHEAIRNIDRPLYLDEATLFDTLRKKVVGQDDALRTLTSVIVRHCARRQPMRPAVVFAVGPSGVGKTRSMEVLAEALRDVHRKHHGYQFLRLDMSEYQEAHRVSQLIGAPQGYIGHGDGSQLVDTLRANPETIVLFDEIEKAHPAILRVLMNAMDAGRLSSASRSDGGHEIDCRRSVFTFTSNVDANSIIDELQARNAFGKSSVEDEVCRRRLHAAGIPAEIVGRIGRFLIYKPLNSETKATIMTLSIREVAAEYGLNVSLIDPSVIVTFMQTTRSESFGVRPDRFLIDEMLGNAFAKAAAQSVTEPVEITGPPFVCKPHARPSTNDNKGKKTTPLHLN